MNDWWSQGNLIIFIPKTIKIVSIIIKWKKKCLKKKERKCAATAAFGFNWIIQLNPHHWLQADLALVQYSNAGVFAHADDVAQCARLQCV